MIEQQTQGIYEFGGYRIEENERLLKRNGEVISLPPKAIDLLLILLKSGGRVMTKDELMQTVWADSFVEETNLTHNISLLRRTLSEKQNGTKFIETIPRRGYRFAADVRTIDGEDFELISLERTNTHIVIEEESESESEIQSERTVRQPPARFRKRFWVVGGLLVLILAAVGIWFYGTGREKVSVKPFQIGEIKRITFNGTVTMSAVSADGKFVAFVTEDSNRQSLWLRNISTESEIAVLSDSEFLFKSVKFGPDDRIYFVSGDILYYVPMLGGPVQKVLNLAGGLVGNVFSFSPDNKQIAFMRVLEDTSSSSIMLADADGKNERELASYKRPKAFLRSPVWSPNGNMLAVITLGEDEYQEIRTVRISDGEVSPAPLSKWEYLLQIEWMPDAQSLLALTGSGEIWSVAYPEGTVSKLTDELSRYSNISRTADGANLIATKTEADGLLWVLPITEKRAARQITRGFDRIDGGVGLDWLSNDKIRYEAGNSYQSWTINIDGGNPVKTVSAITPYSNLSPDKQYIVYQGQDENGYGLHRIKISDGEQKRIGPLGIWARFSPDGKWIVFTRYQSDVSIWKVSSDGSGELIQLTKLAGAAHCPVVSPDNTRVAFVWLENPKSAADPKIAIVSFTDGSLIKTLPIFVQKKQRAGKISKHNIEWAPDGKAIDYIQLRDGVSNIWRQPIDGSPPSQITFFETGRIANFAYSPDFKHLALSRGNFASDVFLIKNAK